MAILVIGTLAPFHKLQHVHDPSVEALVVLGVPKQFGHNCPQPFPLRREPLVGVPHDREDLHARIGELIGALDGHRKGLMRKAAADLRQRRGHHSSTEAFSSQRHLHEDTPVLGYVREIQLLVPPKFQRLPFPEQGIEHRCPGRQLIVGEAPAINDHLQVEVSLLREDQVLTDAFAVVEHPPHEMLSWTPHHEADALGGFVADRLDPLNAHLKGLLFAATAVLNAATRRIHDDGLGIVPILHIEIFGRGRSI
mmetsp:Transcript_32969/g.90939  ORF Transcript_32969/g.90939 Transcript_32969/m.90939 type:complete len:252 (-) Transcript_32969:342-1097(-)